MAKSEGFKYAKNVFVDIDSADAFAYAFAGPQHKLFTGERHLTIHVKARIAVNAKEADRFKYELLVRAMSTRLGCEREKVAAWIELTASGRIL